MLPEEPDELVNEGMWGKSLCMYLEKRLTERGHVVPFYCCEDWGWWVQLKGYQGVPFGFGICVYSLEGSHVEDLQAGDEPVNPEYYALTHSAYDSYQWSWKRFWFVKTQPWAERLTEELLEVFEADPEIEVLGVQDEFPDFR